MDKVREAAQAMLDELDESRAEGRIMEALRAALAVKDEAVPASERERSTESGDWPEDFEHENGNYSCLCCECKRYFIGYKRRVVCKTCVRAKEAATTAPQMPTAQTMGTHWENCYYEHHDCAVDRVESQAVTIAWLERSKAYGDEVITQRNAMLTRAYAETKAQAATIATLEGSNDELLIIAATERNRAEKAEAERDAAQKALAQISLALQERSSSNADKERSILRIITAARKETK